MRIFKLPKEVPAPVVDYSNYNQDKIDFDEKNHQEQLKNHLMMTRV